ncbi:MAG: chromosome segregation protein SMC [Candidatus Riflebacteria bacterium]|nr:chromosome segregation protein SMC [Candidatus Riflebacteria bacterium]
MYLKSLELMGFKSFGRKTVFEFQPGVIAIIGPNGSGKSNVCDAIRWVLGEQSARALRGTKMAEVIFAGTPEVKPAAFSQVKLVLDNEDRKLPIEFSEISIGRQLFRSGESNYFFNSSKTLLSDIREMLMDTGIGKDGYSVIGQGDIDDIIFQRIQSRRVLIEEAAGITKFKHRKASTIQKLDHTRANITRVRDIISEIEMQLGPLSEQAEKTRKYQALSVEIRDLEIDLVFFDLQKLYGENENVDSMRKGLQSKLTEIQLFLADIEKRKAVIRESIAGVEEDLRSKQDLVKRNREEIESAKGDISTFREDIKSKAARKQAITEEIATIETQITNSESEIKDASERLRDEESQEISITGQMAEIEENLSKVQAEFDSFLKEASQDKVSSYEIATRMSDKRNLINTCQQQLLMINRQLEKYVSDVQNLSAVFEKCDSESKRIQSEIDTMKAEIASAEKCLAEEQAKLIKSEKELTRTEDDYNGTVDQIKINQARRNLLEDLKNRGDGGLLRGVREAIALRDQGMSGIFGMVGDLVTVPKGYELAFETALGASIQDIIVRDSDIAQKVIGILKEKKAGRATFLPLDLLQSQPVCDRPTFTGCLGVALDLVQFDPKFYMAMNQLLGRILIFDKLENAVAFSKSSRNYNRIVTLDGEIVRSSGSMTGGFDGGTKGAGILSRKREFEELEEKITSLIAREKKLKVVINNLRNERNTLSTSVHTRNEFIARRRQSLEFFVHTLERTLNERAQKKTELEQFTGDRDELDREKQRLERVVKDTRTDLGELENQNLELSARLQNQAGKEDTIQSRLNSLRSLASEEKLKLVQIAERKKALRKEIESAGKRKLGVSERKKRAEDEVEKLSAEVILSEEKIQIIAKTISDLDEKRVELEKAYEDAQKSSREAGKEIESLDHAYQSRSKIEDSTKNKLAELDIRFAEIRTHIKNKEDILVGEYAIDLNSLSGTRVKFEKREDITELLTRLKFDRERLEPVNPLAIEDYEKTKERHQFLTNQINDLSDAANSLEQVIAEIEKISAERFMETFKLISQSFGEIFQILFPTGEGSLCLSEPNDPLNSNVEIKCRLPGKKLTTVELFSGGEKALISIALLFSILQVKPPAFCVLDEIEASLDEANVKRFCRLLRSFADKTQFLVITHNKETMQAVDVIYGITLEKTGVSRQISIRLEDHDKITEFTISKNKPVHQYQEAAS